MNARKRTPKARGTRNMTPQTLTAIKSLLSTDSTVSAGHRALILSVCREPEIPGPAASCPETYLTPMQVADRLIVRRETVYRWIRQGIIPSKRMGGTKRVPESWINDPNAHGQVDTTHVPPEGK